MFAELVLWTDCDNNCAFCTQNCMRESTTLAEKRTRILKASRWIFENGLNYDRLAFIGGELWDVPGLTAEWRCLAEAIIMAPCKEVVICSNLLMEDLSILTDFLGLISSKKVMIGTSYDPVGRFATEDSYNTWKKNVEELYLSGFLINITSIFSQDLIEKGQDMPDWCSWTIIEPLVDYSCFETELPVDEYRRKLKLNTKIRLPKRDDALNWIRDHPGVRERYRQYDLAHANDIFFYEEGDYIPMFTHREQNQKCSCGHHVYARCYADSDECLQCDIARLEN